MSFPHKIQLSKKILKDFTCTIDPSCFHAKSEYSTFMQEVIAPTSLPNTPTLDATPTICPLGGKTPSLQRRVRDLSVCEREEIKTEFLIAAETIETQTATTLWMCEREYQETGLSSCECGYKNISAPQNPLTHRQVKPSSTGSQSYP